MPKPQVPKDRIPGVASLTDIRLLMGAARQPNDAYFSLRNQTILCLAFDCGLRLSEVAGLSIEDTKLRPGFLRVRAGKGDKERFVAFGRKTERLLQNFLRSRQHFAARRDAGLNDPSAPLLLADDGQPLTRYGVSMVFKRLRKRAGVTCSFHGLRHAYGSELARQSANAQMIRSNLGHTTLAVTMRYIQHFDPSRHSQSRRFSPMDRLLG